MDVTPSAASLTTGDVLSFEKEQKKKRYARVVAYPGDSHVGAMHPVDSKSLSIAALKAMEAIGRAQISRNSPCPCGSRKRFKRCCMKQYTKEEMA